MEPIEFSFQTSLITDEELEKTMTILQNEIHQMNQALNYKYEDDRASINLPDDTDALEKVRTIINEKKKLHPTYIVVVGIGGSNLGTIAVQEAVLGRLHNQLPFETIKVLYADTVDSDLITDIINIIEPVLQKGETVIINGVSKSGSTTETIANFEVLVNLIKKYKEDTYHQYIVVTTDKNSKFWGLAKMKGFDVLEIPKKVGGRYSVFSPVGLFPLGLLDVNIEQLLEGAKIMRDRCLSMNMRDNPAAISACLLFLHNKKGKNIHDLFLFSPDLESVGKWYRQLLSESIGKEFTRDGKQVFNGITPTVSIGSTDLHSMAQLYLGGPYDKFTTFVRVKNNKTTVKIPNLPAYSSLVEGVQGKQLNEIMDAILEGVKKAFEKGGRPFMEIVLPDKSAWSIGQFLQLKMMEIMYLGSLMRVNPFDQPNVEDYKIETRRILEEKTGNDQKDVLPGKT